MFLGIFKKITYIRIRIICESISLVYSYMYNINITGFIHVTILLLNLDRLAWLLLE